MNAVNGEIRVEQPSPDTEGEPVQVTPIWITRRTRNLILAAVVGLLLFAIWRVPVALTMALGGVAFALILSFPVRWLSNLMPRWLATVITLEVLRLVCERSRIRRPLVPGP